MRGIRVGIQGIGGGNEGNQVGNDGNVGNQGENAENKGGNAGDQGENLHIGVGMMKKMWTGIKIKGNQRIYKNIVLRLWYEKQLKKII